MNVLIVASRHDAAGMNIVSRLQEMKKFPAVIGQHKTEILVIDDEITTADYVGKRDADLFVFASRHVSKAGVHSLSIHSIGNWSSAIGGGNARELVPAPAGLMKKCFNLMREKVRSDGMGYEVIQEATHHGPFIEKPAMFIEIGSDEERYNDEMAGRVIAETIVEAVENLNGSKIETFVGIGGMHHCPNFGKVMASPDVAVAYVCPKHALGELDEAMIRQAMAKSFPVAEEVIIDWKGMGLQKERIIKLLDDVAIAYRKTKDFSGIE